LGGNDGELVHIRTKKQKKDIVEVDSYALSKAKSMSKRKAKRFEQIERRKLKESKSDEYYSLLKQHELSEKARDLMTRSAHIGQSKSYRARLTDILKKERAGMKLTSEEMLLLYPNLYDNNGIAWSHTIDGKDTNTVHEDVVEATFIPTDQSTQAVTNHNLGSNEETAMACMMDIEQLMTEDALAFVNPVGLKKVKKRKLKTSEHETDEQTSVSQTLREDRVPMIDGLERQQKLIESNTDDSNKAIPPIILQPSVVGINLLNQFQIIKNKLELKKSQTEDVVTGTQNNQDKADVSISKIYVPQPIEIPNLGLPHPARSEVNRTAPTVSTDTILSDGDILARRPVKIIRNADIQVRL
jgi:hypothetical protein